MSDLLMIQSIGDDPNDRFAAYMDLSLPIHADYAERHGADFRFFRGSYEGLNPTWNRIPMMLKAFEDGYRKVVWLDADVLVVKRDRNVFEETSDDAPLLMTRVLHAHIEMPWGPWEASLRTQGLCGSHKLTIGPTERFCRVPMPGSTAGHAGDHGDGQGPWPQWDVYNDGVLIANNSSLAVEALEFAWSKRREPFRPWHIPGMPELDWILDYVYAFPEAVEELHDRWNWQFEHRCPKDEACWLAWHGEPAQKRWAEFSAAWQEHYG